MTWPTQIEIVSLATGAAMLVIPLTPTDEGDGVVLDTEALA